MAVPASSLLEEASEAYRSGRTSEALTLLEEALAQEPETMLRARIQHLRGVIEVWTQPPMRVHDLLVTEAAGVEALDPGQAAVMLADAARAAVMAGEAETAAETNARGVAIAESCQRPPAELRAFELILARPGPVREDAIRAVLAEIGNGDALQTLDTLLHTATTLYWLEDYANAGKLLRFVIDRGRPVLHPALPVALDTLAAIWFQTGRWTLADACSAEALRLARELGQTWVEASCLTTLASIAAARGREQACREHLRDAHERSVPGDLTSAYGTAAAARLELGLGRPEAAIAELEPLRQSQDERLPWLPLVVPWTPDLIEAYARAGQPDKAAETLEPFRQRAHESGRAWALATAARCAGLLAPDGEFDRHFTEALRQHARTPTPFEQARTELCYGERLRRARRKTDAVPILRSALATFEKLGASIWAERTQLELGRKRAQGAGTGELTLLLTPHELQVAYLVGRGSSNREAASTLFVSPKTIDYHLGNIYKKLGIHSRSELAYQLARQDRGAARPQLRSADYADRSRLTRGS